MHTSQSFYKICIVLILAWLIPVKAETSPFAETTASITEKQGQLIAEGWKRRVNASQSQTDLSVQYYLQQLADELAQAGSLQLNNLSLALIHNNSFNAFAGLGEFMGVYQGLLYHLDDEDALASILAHELGHMHARHIERLIERQKNLGATNLGSLISGLIIASTLDAQAGMAIVLSGQALTINQLLSFSRNNETEADQIAGKLLEAAGRDRHGFQRAMSQIARQQQVMGTAPAWLSSHPLAEARLATDLNPRQQSQAPGPELDFWAAKTRVMRSSLPSQAPSWAHELNTLIQKPEKTEQHWQELLVTLEDKNARLAQITLIELICQQSLPQCKTLTQTQLLIDPDQPALRIALVDHKIQNQDYASAWRTLQASNQALQREPAYWQRRALLLNQLEQPIAAISAQGQWMWWRGQEDLALQYLENQSRRLGDQSLRQLWQQLNDNR